MKRNVSGVTVAIVLLLLLGGIQLAYWRTLVYQPPARAAGGGGGMGPSATVATVARGREDLVVSTPAGTGLPGYRDGRAGRAQFDGPAGLAVDRAGAIFVADTRNHRIRRIGPDGQVTTAAGTGSAGDTIGGYADGPVDRCRFRCPAGVAVSTNGTLYVADTGNHCIRRISGPVVATLAGKGGIAGEADGAGAAARFRQPSGLALDASGSLYVADTGNGAVRKVEPSGRVTTLARGGGLKAPTGVALDRDGSVLVSDPGARRALRIPAAGGSPSPLSFRIEEGIAAEPASAVLAPDGTLVMTDVARNVLFAVTDGEPSLLAGVLLAKGARLGWTDGPGSLALFDAPFGIAADRTGALLVADYANNCIRRIGR